MFKRRSVQRNINKNNKNKAVATVGMVVGTTVASPIVTLVASNKAYAQTPQHAFIAKIAPAAQLLAQQNDLYASVMIAQAILETGWGNSTLSAAPNYNLFGIKGAYNGESVNMRTVENTPDGKPYYINDDFRKYPSYTESLQDYVTLLKGKYYSGAWKSRTTSYKQATLYLTGRYATAVNYNTSLDSLIEQYNLTQYDSLTNSSSNVAPVQPVIPEPVQPIENTVTVPYIPPVSVVQPIESVESVQSAERTIAVAQTGTTKTYTVKSGDSVWLIAHNHGITMSELKAWNNLTSDLIHPGQVLKVSQASVTTNVETQPATVASAQPIIAEPVQSTESIVTVQPAENTAPVTQVEAIKMYTVKSGDSVWLIAHNHGITMAELKVWNNLTSDLIHPGQVLKVSQVSVTTNVETQPATVASAQPIIAEPVQPIENTVTVQPAKNTAPATQAEATKMYTVKSGDSVWLISHNHGITMSELKAWNNLTSDLIHPGQVLKVSKGSIIKTTTTTTTHTNVSTQPVVPLSLSKLYTVKSGDSIWKIAYENGMSMAQLRAINGLSGDLIHPGQVLRLA